MSDFHKPSDEKLEEYFKKISTRTAVAVAVSGGVDSLALLLLADRWRRNRLDRNLPAPDLTIFTIDHGFRPEAIEECRFVVDRTRALGHAAEILQWEGPRPTSRLLEKAREIRYQLLAAACHQHGIKTLMTAHHMDDQAETFLMRLARGGGVDGLSAMPPHSHRYGLCLLRPLLELQKEDLVRLLQNNDWEHVEDPSNKDPRFERTRLRQNRDMLKKIGLSAPMISLAASRLRRAKSALNEFAARFLSEHALVSDYGTARIDQLALHDIPEEIALRALSKILRVWGGSQDVPNMARLEKLLAGLKADFDTNRTLAGCRIIAKGDFWLIVREAGRIRETEKPVIANGCMFWDNRYIVCANDSPLVKDITAGPLMQPEEFAGEVDKKLIKTIPREALASLLALRCKGKIIALPALDFWSGEAVGAGLRVRFISSDESSA